MNPEPASGVIKDILFDQNLFWEQAGDAVELSKDDLNATRELEEVLGCAVTVSKNYNLDLVQQLTWEVHYACWMLKADWCELVEPDGKIVEQSMRIQLLPDDMENVAWIQSQVSAKDR